MAIRFPAQRRPYYSAQQPSFSIFLDSFPESGSPASFNFTLHSPHSSLPYAHTSQITSAPETAAMRVKGTPMRKKSFVSTL